MRTYIGTKVIAAKPMNKIDYCSYRGWIMPDDEDPMEEGYLVEYEGTENQNHKDHVGYISWSPKDTFDKAYKFDGVLTFGHAIELMKRGECVCRSGWNGKGMFIFLVPGSTFKANRPPLLGIYEEGTEINYHAHIDMKTADGTIVPWLASQSDMLATDWCIY